MWTCGCTLPSPFCESFSSWCRQYKTSEKKNSQKFDLCVCLALRMGHFSSSEVRNLENWHKNKWQLVKLSDKTGAFVMNFCDKQFIFQIPAGCQKSKSCWHCFCPIGLANIYYFPFKFVAAQAKEEGSRLRLVSISRRPRIHCSVLMSEGKLCLLVPEQSQDSSLWRDSEFFICHVRFLDNGCSLSPK